MDDGWSDGKPVVVSMQDEQEREKKELNYREKFSIKDDKGF